MDLCNTDNMYEIYENVESATQLCTIYVVVGPSSSLSVKGSLVLVPEIIGYNAHATTLISNCQNSGIG